MYSSQPSTQRPGRPESLVGVLLKTYTTKAACLAAHYKPQPGIGFSRPAYAAARRSESRWAISRTIWSGKRTNSLPGIKRLRNWRVRKRTPRTRSMAVRRRYKSWRLMKRMPTAAAPIPSSDLLGNRKTVSVRLVLSFAPLFLMSRFSSYIRCFMFLISRPTQRHSLCRIAALPLRRQALQKVWPISTRRQPGG